MKFVKLEDQVLNMESDPLNIKHPNLNELP